MSDAPNPIPAPTPPPAPPQQRQLAVELPNDLSPVYSNFAVITHSPSELVVDFATVLPNMPRAKVSARVVMTPMNAKLFLRALGENLSRYEGQFGEIKLPEGVSLADHLFRPPKPPEGPNP